MNANNDIRSPLFTPQAQQVGSLRSQTRTTPLTRDELDMMTPEMARKEMEHMFGRPEAVGAMFRKPAVWPPVPASQTPAEKAEAAEEAAWIKDYRAKQESGEIPQLKLFLPDGTEIGAKK